MTEACAPPPKALRSLAAQRTNRLEGGLRDPRAGRDTPVTRPEAGQVTAPKGEGTATSASRGNPRAATVTAAFTVGRRTTARDGRDARPTAGGLAA